MIPPLLLEVAAAVSPDGAEYEVSEHLPVNDDEHSYDIRWRLGGKGVEMRIDPALFTDMVNFGERMVRAELEHEARNVVAQLTGEAA